MIRKTVPLNQVRIIGGQWRGRPVSFLPSHGLRPTPDRVRETLFNWLMFEIQGARCLDLFAGTGVLGLEALSRGAAFVQAVEKNRDAVQHMQHIGKTLQVDSDHWQIAEADAVAWLSQFVQGFSGEAQAFDVILVDPPYDSPLLNKVIALLAQYPQVLKSEGVIYWETGAQSELVLPAGCPFQIRKQKRAGQVRYGLLGRW